MIELLPDVFGAGNENGENHDDKDDCQPHVDVQAPDGEGGPWNLAKTSQLNLKKTAIICRQGYIFWPARKFFPHLLLKFFPVFVDFLLSFKLHKGI